jgi:hypothetical protein
VSSYSAHLMQEKFRGRRFATEDPRLLDFEGAEIVFIGARTDPEDAHHIDLQPEQESERSANIVRQLRFAKTRHPAEPLLKGECASAASNSGHTSDGQAVPGPNRRGAARAARADLCR